MTPISPETERFIALHASDDVRTLALQARKFPMVDMPVAITQIAGRQAAAGKIPSWHAVEGIRYPQHLPLEQCSSELTARYKAGLVQGDALADLTGGFGIDCAFLAARFRTVTYVERLEELCILAAHNFTLLNLSHITVKHADSVEHLRVMSPVDCIFIDPARRDGHGGKTVAIADCEPDVTTLQPLLLKKARRVLIKLSPMLDLSLALRSLTHTEAVHILSVENECKELLLMLGSTPPDEVTIHCVNLSAKGTEQHFTFTREAEQRSECRYADIPGAYLYEPNASLLKGGAYRSLVAAYPSLRKLHPNSHLYTSDVAVSDFPGRSFRITGYGGWSKKELKELLGDLKKANLTVRNFPATVAELRKRLRLAEGGDTYLFATTLNNEEKKLIRCLKV